jgi:hypothetical protein
MLNFLMILLICFGILANNICIQSVSCQKQSQDIQKARAKLRGFDVGLHLLDLYQLRQKLKKLRNEHERRNKVTLKEEIFEENATRSRIYEHYLLRFQGGSSFLRDFHTNRF